MCMTCFHIIDIYEPRKIGGPLLHIHGKRTSYFLVCFCCVWTPSCPLFHDFLSMMGPHIYCQADVWSIGLTVRTLATGDNPLSAVGFWEVESTLYPRTSLSLHVVWSLTTTRNIVDAHTHVYESVALSNMYARHNRCATSCTGVV